MRHALEQKVLAFTVAHRLIAPGHRVLVAVSGGADSVALVSVLNQLRADRGLEAELHCVHLNHQLRGQEADADEQSVKDLARDLGLSCICKRLDVRGFARAHSCSIETAGRDLRRRELTSIAGLMGCQSIATAHHKDDNAETVAHRFLRGTGFRGLAGIWPIVASPEGIRWVRPLLCLARHEILGYLRDMRLSWREDRSNQDCRYTRNRIRHRLLPALHRDCGRTLTEDLAGLADAAYRLQSRIDTRVQAIRSGTACPPCDQVTLDANTLCQEHPLVQVELIRRTLAQVGCGERDLSEYHYQRLLRLVQGLSPGHCLPGGFEATSDGHRLTLGRGYRPIDSAVRYDPATLDIPGQTRVGTFLIAARITDMRPGAMDRFIRTKDRLVEWLDWDSINPPLVVRHRRPGDRFQPLGHPTDKKVGKFLTDACVPEAIRDAVRVVEDRDKIVWLCPVRVSEQVKVTPGTRRVLELHASGTQAQA